MKCLFKLKCKGEACYVCQACGSADGKPGKCCGKKRLKW